MIDPGNENKNALAVKDNLRHRDLTQGSIVKNLLTLSWPMIVMEATYMISQMWDMLWVGRASGSAAIAAVGIGSLLILLLSVVDAAIIAGARAMVARFVGAREPEMARKVAGQSFLLAIGWGIIVTIFGAAFAADILNLFGLEADVVAEGTKYLRIIFTGWLSLELLITGLYTIQSTGDSFTPMVIEIIMRSVHLILTPLLVLGIGFPAMGIAGAALSNVISQSIGALSGLWVLFTGFSRIKLKLSDFRFSPGMIWRILKIGLPSTVSVLLQSLSTLVVTKILVPFGTRAVAADRIVGNIQNFISTPNFGLGGAVAVLVGQNLGARQPERAVRSTWIGTAILTGFLFVCCVIILFFAEQIVGVFLGSEADPEVLAIGVDFLKISIPGFLVMGLNAALMNGIGGAGDTVPNMFINTGMIWAVQVPLTYYLANNTSLGVNGIRWALVISFFTGAVAFFLYFQSGRWKKKKV